MYENRALRLGDGGSSTVHSVDRYDLTRIIKARDVRVRACSTHGREMRTNFERKIWRKVVTWRTKKYVGECCYMEIK